MFAKTLVLLLQLIILGEDTQFFLIALLVVLQVPPEGLKASDPVVKSCSEG